MSPIPDKAKAIIDHLGMENIPHEGPWFLETHKSKDIIEGALAERYSSPRYAHTAIYAVLTHDDFSAMHRLATDELWHFYAGEPAQILLLFPDGHGEIRTFGSDLLAGQEPQIMAPAGVWMGARSIGPPETAWTLAGNTLSPGFEYEDYEPGYRKELIEQYPDFAEIISALTRNDSIERND